MSTGHLAVDLPKEGYFIVAAVQLGRDRQRSRVVAAAGLEIKLLFPDLQKPPTADQVGRDALRRTVALFRVLRQQFHNDVRQAPRDHRDPFTNRRRLLGQMAMDQLERVACAKRRLVGQQLVERSAQGVKIGTMVDGAIQPAGLFG